MDFFKSLIVFLRHFMARLHVSLMAVVSCAPIRVTQIISAYILIGSLGILLVLLVHHTPNTTSQFSRIYASCVYETELILSVLTLFRADLS